MVAGRKSPNHAGNGTRPSDPRPVTGLWKRNGRFDCTIRSERLTNGIWCWVALRAEPRLAAQVEAVCRSRSHMLITRSRRSICMRRSTPNNPTVHGLSVTHLSTCFRRSSIKGAGPPMPTVKHETRHLIA